MLLERFEDRGLSQYSYAVGCEAIRRVAIVDPRRDVDVYLDWLAQRKLTLDCVLDTHIHADYASGARELAERTGARLLASRHDRGERFAVSMAHEPIGDGDRVDLGAVRLTALHTPGHTPEHLSILVHDRKRSQDVPIAMLTGDFLFVGSLGRPDLLGEDAKVGLAHALFRSVRQVLGPLPGGLEIHPGHGAGSMCGAGMSGRPFSTLGFERVANPYLDPRLDEDAFVARILSNPPPQPPYFVRMKEMNSRGPRVLGELPGGTELPAARVRELAQNGEVLVVDVRNRMAFGRGHVPGALGIGLDDPLLSTFAGWAVPTEAHVVLVGEEAQELSAAVRALVRVGIDGIVGHLGGGFAAWERAGYPVATLPQVAAEEIAARSESGALTLVDIRDESEWRQGHAPQAVHIPGGALLAGAAEAPAGPLAFICGSGYRSTVVASALLRDGRTVANVAGGMGAWRRAGLPVSAVAAG